MLLFVIIASFSLAPLLDMLRRRSAATRCSHFWKNISMMGGLVLLFITGAGRILARLDAGEEALAISSTLLRTSAARAALGWFRCLFIALKCEYRNC